MKIGNKNNIGMKTAVDNFFEPNEYYTDRRVVDHFFRWWNSELDSGTWSKFIQRKLQSLNSQIDINRFTFLVLSEIYST